MLFEGRICYDALMMDFGCRNEVSPLRRVLLKRPGSAFCTQAAVDEQWRELHYSSPPDLMRADEEHDVFTATLKREGVRVEELPEDGRTGLDSIYVRDAALVTADGVILGRMGKSQRQSEPSAAGAFLKSLGLPVLGGIEGVGCLEGGDVIRLDGDILAVGIGYRTNREGVRQLRRLTGDRYAKIIEVPLPSWNGPCDVLHLMSLVSPVSERSLLVHSRLLPVFFLQEMRDLGYQLIEAAEEEYASMAVNVLALAPGLCLALSGNPLTKERLRREGITVIDYDGEDLSVKGSGGPTCLTLPLH
ncbi:MAG: arginine deiminase family protein, partial [Candidatus Aminicenantes bacterium]|nr:arginine deiminase family protein [Candidatus Aminicenantes bacterium]